MKYPHKLIKRKTYYDVVAYYCNTTVAKGEKRELYLSTGFKVPHSHVKANSKGVKEIKKTFPEYDELILKLKELTEKIDSIVTDYNKKYFCKPSVSFVEENLNQPIKRRLEVAVDYFYQWIEEEKNNLTKKGSRDIYFEVGKWMEEYELKLKKPIQLVDFDNMPFIERFVLWLSQEKKICDNTLVRKFKILNSFIKWVDNVKKVPLNTTLLYKVKDKWQIKNYDKSKFSLTKEELRALVNFKPEQHERTKDLFIFMILTGMRISDTLSFNATQDVQVLDGVEYIVKNSIKTGGQFKVKFQATAKAIYEKYGNVYISDKSEFNRNLKSVMKEFYTQYKEQYDLTHSHPYNLDFKKVAKYCGVEVVEVVKKWDSVSSHYGRGSFISILAMEERLEVFELASMTGQKDLKVLASYVREVRHAHDISQTFGV